MSWPRMEANRKVPQNSIPRRSSRRRPVSNYLSSYPGISSSQPEPVFDTRPSRSLSPPKPDRASQFPSASRCDLREADELATAASANSAAEGEGQTPVLRSSQSRAGDVCSPSTKQANRETDSQRQSRPG